MEIRLNELYDVVDYFVLVEARETFSGKKKPLYYWENESLFRKFQDKIIHVVINEYFSANSFWEREFYQRDQIMRGLPHCADHDIILVSDLDEIPRASCMSEIVETVRELSIAKNTLVTCQQRLYAFNLNRYNPAFWTGTVALSYAQLRRIGPEKARESRVGSRVIYDAGWHFQAMGGHQKYIAKLESYSHADVMDKPEYKTNESIEMHKDSLQWIPINETYPKFVLENLSYLKEKGLIEEKPY